MNCAFGIIPPKLHLYESTADLPAFDLTNLNAHFLLYRVIQKDFYLKNGSIADGSRKAKRIHTDTFLNMEILTPKLLEQNYIANFLLNLDNIITLHQRKCEKLKIFKKAMLEKMFPKNNDKIPEVRFNGFTDAWEQCILKNKTSLITKGTTPLNKNNIGTVNFIKIENINSETNQIQITNKISLEEHNNYLKRSQLQDNDILFSIAGTLGRTAIITSKLLPANTNQALAIIRIHNGNIEYFRTYLTGTNVKKFIRQNPTIGAQPNLSLQQLEHLDVTFPNLDEQKKIGQYFKALDNLITLHQRKVEKLQIIKKSMLKKMFV